MKINGARMVCESLVAEGVRTVFGLPGGAIMPLYDVLPDFPLKHILVRHEQGAAHMADGYGRASGDVGVCFATSGPGAINLVTGLANAMMDSAPVVAITANVATAVIGADAVQEADITGVSLPDKKHRSPVSNTLPGVSNFPGNSDPYLGMMGMHGTASACDAVDQADLVVGVGIRFDDRAMGKYSAFAPRAKVVHIDIDPAEIGKNVRTDVPIVADCKSALQALNKELGVSAD